jgi:hypothetical protein
MKMFFKGELFGLSLRGSTLAAWPCAQMLTNIADCEGAHCLYIIPLGCGQCVNCDMAINLFELAAIMIALNLFTFIRATSGARQEHEHVISTASLTDRHPISESTFVEDFCRLPTLCEKPWCDLVQE